jgi:putative membrane protein
MVARSRENASIKGIDQYGAYSQNGKSGPLRRYAQETLPKSQALLEYAKRLAGGR